MSRDESNHKIIDGVQYKICNKCEERFPVNTEYFYKHKTNKDGLFPTCKNCVRERSSKWGEENRERKYKNNKKYIYSPKGRIAYRNIHNRYRGKGKQLEWQRKNKDKIKQYGLVRANKVHEITDGEWESCLKYFGYKCAYCGISEDEAIEKFEQRLHREHVDHEGENDLSNNVPSCKSCNSKKWVHDFLDWYNEDNKVFDVDRLYKIMKWLQEDYQYYLE